MTPIPFIPRADRRLWAVLLGLAITIVPLYRASRPVDANWIAAIDGAAREVVRVESQVVADMLHARSARDRCGHLPERLDHLRAANDDLRARVDAVSEAVSHDFEEQLVGLDDALGNLGAVSSDLQERLRVLRTEIDRLPGILEAVARDDPEAWSSTAVRDVVATLVIENLRPSHGSGGTARDELESTLRELGSRNGVAVADLAASVGRIAQLTRGIDSAIELAEANVVGRAAEELCATATGAIAEAGDSARSLRGSLELILALTVAVLAGGFLVTREPAERLDPPAAPEDPPSWAGHVVPPREEPVAVVAVEPPPIIPKPARPVTPLHGKRILLAEDGKDNQRLVQYLLSKAGARTDVVENGRLAFDTALEADRGDTPYDIVLMDMSMPVMDGYEATRRLRDSGYERPIVAVTAFTQPGDRHKCLSSGCDVFVGKPIDLEEFMRTLERIVAGGGSSEEDAPLFEVVREDPVEEEDEGPLISEFVDDEDMFELVEWFVRDLCNDLEAIEKALSEDDIEGLATLAHQLKGSAGSYGFSRLSEQADRLEQCAQNGEDRARIETEARAFLKLCQRVQL